MPRHTDSRARAIATAEQLFRTQGYAATGLAQIIAESGSPKGSFYFHFPDGKSQLAAEALTAYVDRVDAMLRRLADRHAGDAAGFVRAVFRAIAAEMHDAQFQLSCLVQVLITEHAPDNAVLAARLNRALDGWAAVIGAHLEACGFAPEQARRTARSMVMLLQGARVLARIERSPQPLAEAEALLLGALNAVS